MFFKQDNCRVELTMSIGNAAFSSAGMLLIAGASTYDSPFYFRADTNGMLQLFCPGAAVYDLTSSNEEHTLAACGKIN